MIIRPRLNPSRYPTRLGPASIIPDGWRSKHSGKGTDEIDVERVRRILEAIRSRLGGRFRPRCQLDYLERRLRVKLAVAAKRSSQSVQMRPDSRAED
jgi:hypothetical protein